MSASSACPSLRGSRRCLAHGNYCAMPTPPTSSSAAIALLEPTPRSQQEYIATVGQYMAAGKCSELITNPVWSLAFVRAAQVCPSLSALPRSCYLRTRTEMVTCRLRSSPVTCWLEPATCQRSPRTVRGLLPIFPQAFPSRRLSPAGPATGSTGLLSRVGAALGLVQDPAAAAAGVSDLAAHLINPASNDPRAPWRAGRERPSPPCTSWRPWACPRRTSRRGGGRASGRCPRRRAVLRRRRAGPRRRCRARARGAAAGAAAGLLRAAAPGRVHPARAAGAGVTGEHRTWGPASSAGRWRLAAAPPCRRSRSRTASGAGGAHEAPRSGFRPPAILLSSAMPGEGVGGPWQGAGAPLLRLQRGCCP